jgi:hypothetical protein
MTDTLTLPSPVTLRSAGSVADEVELNVEVDGVARKRETQRVGQFTITADDITSVSTTGGTGYSCAVTSIARTDALAISSSDASSHGICSKFYSVPRQSPYWAQNNSIVVNGSGNVRIVDNSLTTIEQFKALCPITVNYELASDVVTLLDPIPDPFIQVEGGGTIKPVQTNEPEIDSAMTVTYVNKVTA